MKRRGERFRTFGIRVRPLSIPSVYSVTRGGSLEFLVDLRYSSMTTTGPSPLGATGSVALFDRARQGAAQDTLTKRHNAKSGSYLPHRAEGSDIVPYAVCDPWTSRESMGFCCVSEPASCSGLVLLDSSFFPSYIVPSGYDRCRPWHVLFKRGRCRDSVASVLRD